MALLLLLAGSGFAEPVDLADPAPRWIEVAFEVSPRDRPAQTDTVYTPKIRARLEPDAAPGLARVTVDRGEVERVLLADQNPVAGSFSDFVWVFDAASGEVLSATVSGTLRQDLDWGLFRTKVKTQIEVDMATSRTGGFERPRHWLGQQIFAYCEAERGRSAPCTLVSPRPYDAESGYVNAVGDVSVRYGDMSLRTFSPLGEAVFSEVEPRLSLSPAGSDPNAAAVAVEARTVTADSARPPPFGARLQ